MKKVIAFLLGMTMMFSLIACGEAKASTPYSATDSAGKTVDTVIDDFSSCGFTNVTEKALEDLTLDEFENNGIVESVTINSLSDFSGNQEFATASSVIVFYHSFAKVAAPIDYESAQTTDASDLIALFNEAGFVNIRPSEVVDLDPDDENLEFKNDVTINGESNFSSNSKYPLDSEIEIITHKAYEKYTLKFSVDFIGNLFFNTYDVEVNVNGQVDKLEHGKDGTFEYRLRKGTYTIVFSDVASSSVKGTTQIELSGDVDAAYKISCHSNEIAVETLYVENKSAVGENEAMVPYSASACKYTDYREIKKIFENAGFSNISTEPLYDIVWGWTVEGEVESVTIDSQSEFIRGDIFSKDIPIIITYHTKEEDDPNKKPDLSEQTATEKTYNLDVGNKSVVGENEAMVPYSASACKYTDYQEIKKEFENAGFSNISTEPLYDIVWGWTDEGEVESVTIDGQSEFICGDIFSKDIPIVITYHMKEDDDPNKKPDSSEQTVPEKTYNLDKDLIVAHCAQDKDKTTMYRVIFAECDSNGNYTNFYTFDTIINPREMGKEFNVIGPLPSWFYVGATVHVKGNLSGNTISQSGCSVTEVKTESENATTESIPMPIIAGTSLNSIVVVGTDYGLSAQFSDEDWGHSTKMHGMSSSGLSLKIVYSTATKEALSVSVVTYPNHSTKQEQKDFINAVAKVSCPSTDSDDVLKWIASNIGTEASTIINGTTYSLTTGPSGNLCYNAGTAEWETWELSHY